MEVVINACYGGFSISPEAALWLWKNGLKEKGFVTPVGEYFHDLDRDDQFGYKDKIKAWRKWQINPEESSMFLTYFTPDEKNVLSSRPETRNDPLLVKCVKELGEKVNGRCSQLEIVEIPDGVEFVISEYDGIEHIAEAHRTWR